MLESHQEGMPRPSPGIYKLCMERLGVQPQESILLDSSSQNLKAAAQLGMKTVKVQSDTARVGFGSGFLGAEVADSCQAFCCSLCLSLQDAVGLKQGLLAKSPVAVSFIVPNPPNLREVSSPSCSSVPIGETAPSVWLRQPHQKMSPS